MTAPASGPDNVHATVLSPGGRELRLVRAYDAPRALVFRAWTDARHLARWWGPEGFTNPVCELDARPGGAIRIDMRAPDGTVYPASGMVEDIAEPERLVMMLSPLDAAGRPVLAQHTAITFEARDGRTVVTVVVRIVKEAPDATRYLAGMEAGWSQSLERLGDAVAQREDRVLAFSRLFDAPRALVWEAWTDPAHVGQWWGPNGFTTTTSEMDVRPGGHWRLVMHGPDGTDYRNHIVFVEVMPPERLVYKHVPEPGTEAVSFETTVTFAEVGGKTALAMRMIFPSAAALDHVVKRYGALEGATQTLGRLEVYVTAAARARDAARGGRS